MNNFTSHHVLHQYLTEKRKSHLENTERFNVVVGLEDAVLRLHLPHSGLRLAEEHLPKLSIYLPIADTNNTHKKKQTQKHRRSPPTSRSREHGRTDDSTPFPHESRSCEAVGCGGKRGVPTGQRYVLSHIHARKNAKNFGTHCSLTTSNQGFSLLEYAYPSLHQMPLFESEIFGSCHDLEKALQRRWQNSRARAFRVWVYENATRLSQSAQYY